MCNTYKFGKRALNFVILFCCCSCHLWSEARLTSPNTTKYKHTDDRIFLSHPFMLLIPPDSMDYFFKFLLVLLLLSLACWNDYDFVFLGVCILLLKELFLSSLSLCLSPSFSFSLLFGKYLYDTISFASITHLFITINFFHVTEMERE